MPPLWQVDQELFRAIHVGLRREWLDAIVVAVTFTGLGYAQGIWLLLAILRKRVDFRLLIGLSFGVAVAVALCEKSPLAFAASVLGTALLLPLKRPVAACAFWSLVASGIARLVIVPAVGRQRPSNFDYARALENVHGFSSFPSGHMTTTSAIATVVCWNYVKTDEAWLAWLTAGWAIAVGFSRIYVGVHYPLDVIAGGVLGIAIGSVLCWVWQWKRWFDQPTTPSDRNLE